MTRTSKFSDGFPVNRFWVRRCAALIPIALFVAFIGACVAPDSSTDPSTDKSPVLSVSADSDPFLWLEDVTGERALDWVRTQNARSKKSLASDKLFDELYDEALTILGNDARIPYGSISGGYVYNFWQDTEHVRGLWRRMGLADYVAGGDAWETLIDVDQLARDEQRNWVWSGARCVPPQYDRCLVDLSDGGTDASISREYSLANGTFVENGFYVAEAKSTVQWLDRDTLLVATDFGAGSLTDSGYPAQTRIWRRGTDLADATPFVAGLTGDVGLFPVTLRDGDDAYPTVVRAKTFFEYAVHVRLPDGSVAELPLPARVDIVGMASGSLIAHIKEDWTHGGQSYTADSVVSMSLDASTKFPTQLVYAPGPSEALSQVSAGDSDVYVVVLDDVIGKLKRVVNQDGAWSARVVDLPDNGTVGIRSANGRGNDLLVSYESLTVPDRLYYIAGDDGLNVVASLPSLYAATDVAVEQRFALSKDGTRVPYFVMGKRDVLARGNAPTVQYGYGGFEVPILPSYYADPGRPQHGALAGQMWVSRGGVLVLSNIRGGGEYGPAWHQAALKANRQRAFDDFIAIGEALVSSGLTTPERLGAIGRSNGGLLMGAIMTQRPDLYAAIDCGVPLLDMLRYHKLLAGASWVGEYGDPDVPGERAYIETYSPYQALQASETYPRVLFYTSTKDDRVHPGHARKMAAKMASMGHGFDYYENIEGGHGGTANQAQLAYRTALEYRFFFAALMP